MLVLILPGVQIRLKDFASGDVGVVGDDLPECECLRLTSRFMAFCVLSWLRRSSEGIEGSA